MRSNKLLLGVVAVVAAAGAYWFLLLAPEARGGRRARRPGVDEAGRGRSRPSRRWRATAPAQRRYKVNYATVARLGKAVPADDDVRSLVVQLEAAADDEQGRLPLDRRRGGAARRGHGRAGAAATSPPARLQPVGTAGFPSMPFTLQFTGSYLRLVEASSRGSSGFVHVRNEQAHRRHAAGSCAWRASRMSPSATATRQLDGAGDRQHVPRRRRRRALTDGATASAAGSTTTAVRRAATAGTTTPVTPATTTGALR